MAVRRFRFRVALRRIPLHASLALPAAIYVALGAAMPPQYRFVVADAADRLWPFAGAVLILTAFAACTFWALRAKGLLTPLPAILASACVAAAVATGLLVGASLLLVLACGGGAGLILFLFFRLLCRQAGWDRIPERLRTLWPALVLALATYFGFGLSTSIDPIGMPRSLGTFALLAVFAGALATVFACAVMKPKFGALAIAYGLVALLLFDTNSHLIPAAQGRQPAHELDEALSAWLLQRRDLATYRDSHRPYPVIFVSSEGGGIYAAAHAYGALTNLARHCPTFSQHVFVTVGVSGGALGNALFAGAVDPVQRAHAPCAPTPATVDPAPVATDHLSPVVARLLLVEPVDRLIPGKWMSHDRGQILTDSFLSVAHNPELMRSAITDSFDPRSARPSLVAVAVNVADGRRLVMAPFQPSEFNTTAEWWPGGASFAENGRGDRQISLLDAAGVAARFPWITPTARLRVSDNEDLILADGGYFDNSGADTVLDLINDLRLSHAMLDFLDHAAAAEAGAEAEPRTECDTPEVRIARNFHDDVDWGRCTLPIFIIHLALASRESDAPAPAARPSQSFILDPLTALLATRGSRAEIALQRSELDRCGTHTPGSECLGEPGSSMGYFRNDIIPTDWDLPLGWYMPRASFESLVRRSMPGSVFDYRRRRQEATDDLEILIFHFDPALNAPNASPSIADLLGGP
jgi:hypothetical protein